MLGKMTDRTLKRHSDAWNGDSGTHLASGLPTSSKNAYHWPKSRFIWGIPVQSWQGALKAPLGSKHTCRPHV
jgi:hypothetical protein